MNPGPMDMWGKATLVVGLEVHQSWKVESCKSLVCFWSETNQTLSVDINDVLGQLSTTPEVQNLIENLPNELKGINMGNMG